MSLETTLVVAGEQKTTPVQRPPFTGWSAIVSQVALTYTATIVVALAAESAGRPDLIHSPKCVLSYIWESFES